MTVINDKLTISKFFASPRELVYEAWTQPEHAEKWGPGKLKMQLDYSDLRVGGTYHITMIGENSTHVNTGVYKEIVPDEKLVFTHGWDGTNRVDTTVTVQFLNKKGGTEIILTQVGFKNQEMAASHEEGWSSALDNLDKYLHQFQARGNIIDGIDAGI